MSGENVAIYKEHGGARQVVGSGASLDVESGGEIDIESGGSLKLAGTAVTATAADLNAASTMVGSITVTAANAAANTIDVAIAVLDPGGAAISGPVVINVWLSDLADGTGGSVHTHSTGPAFTAGSIQSELISTDAWLVLTTATGTATLRLVDTANEDVTINACLGTVLGQDTTVSGDWSS